MALQSDETSAQSNKAATLVMALNKDVLAKVLKHLSESELTRLTQAYENEGGEHAPDEQKLVSVGREFLGSAASGANGHFKEALVLAVGEDSASQILRQDRWRALAKRVAPPALAALLKDERPETIGIVLAKLPSLYSADLLAQLPENVRAESIERLTRSNPVGAAAAEALATALEEGVNSGATGATDSMAGVKAAAAMLNRLESQAALAIVEQLRASEPARADALEHAMFHFENLLTLDARVLERILSEVQTDKLTTALKGLPNEQRDIILGSLTDQVKAMVTAELEESGRVAASDVRAARRDISTLALQLEHDGKVRLHADEQEMLA
jgi:flagellar motor switch protein FliG